MFLKLEKVFYPHHGAGEIQDVQEKEILGEKRTYYIIRFPLTETTIMVPADNTEELGLRHIADHKEIKRCFELITSDDSEADEDWKVRYKKHQDMLKSGTTREVTIVIRNLYDRNRVKELSTTEKKLYNNAIRMLISEIALSIGKNQDEVKIELFRLLESRHIA
jgi:CarD family transcriptional regulator